MANLFMTKAEELSKDLYKCELIDLSTENKYR